jgi:hypothetical protein
MFFHKKHQGPISTKASWTICFLPESKFKNGKNSVFREHLEFPALRTTKNENIKPHIIAVETKLRVTIAGTYHGML